LNSALAIFEQLGAERDIADTHAAQQLLGMAGTGVDVISSADADDAIVRRLVDASAIPDLLVRETASALLDASSADHSVLYSQMGSGEILVMAVLATAMGLVLGAAVGLTAAYSRNKLDDVLMRGMDVILAFPQIMLALVAMATVGPKAWIIVLTVGLTTMPRVARVTRGAAQPIVERDFVSAAEALGVPRFRILAREVLPNVLSPLLVEANLRLTYAVALIASLAFLGFTPTPNGADWGLMIQENQVALGTNQPWGVVLPMAAIALLTIGTGLVADGFARAAAGIDRSRGAE